MWERTRRLSASLGSHHGGYTEFSKTKENPEDSTLVLDLGMDLETRIDMDAECEVKETNVESPVSKRSTLSIEGFEVTDTVGGTNDEKAVDIKSMEMDTPTKGRDDEEEDCSSSDGDEYEAAIVAVAERRPLVRAN